MKKKIIFRGVGTALITPFTADNEVDYPALLSLIELQIAAGVDALVIGGTTGEAATLSDAERYELYSRAIDAIAGRARVILGTGTNDTAVAVAHTKTASALACDGVLCVTPYYNKGTDAGLTEHYLRIAEASRAPVILYNVPSRTGVNLPLAVLDRLAEHENIVALKEAGDSAERLVALAAFGERLGLYAGNDAALYSVLALGGLGGISVVSNVAPRRMEQVCELWFEGRHHEARLAALRLLPLCRALFAETNPTPVKYAMHLCGLCRPDVRLPLALPQPATRALLAGALAELGILPPV